MLVYRHTSTYQPKCVEIGYTCFVQSSSTSHIYLAHLTIIKSDATVTVA